MRGGFSSHEVILLQRFYQFVALFDKIADRYAE
jgi:hypothetical protein